VATHCIKFLDFSKDLENLLKILVMLAWAVKWCRRLSGEPFYVGSHDLEHPLNW
jgi:hypothetical protein